MAENRSVRYTCYTQCVIYFELKVPMFTTSSFKHNEYTVIIITKCLLVVIKAKCF